MKNHVHTVVAESFQKEVLEEKQPVLILYADRNSEFADLLTALNDFSNQSNHFVKTGVLAENFTPVFQITYRVIGSPTFILFDHGVEKGRLLGRANCEKISDWIDGLVVFH